LAAYLLADIVDLSFLLKCDKDIRIARMMKRDSDNIEKKIKETELREISEHKRFKELYEIDIHDGRLILETFDYVLDTSKLDIEGESKIISNIIDEYLRCLKLDA
jgi:cytidylate kinase